jgi:hypothetical protein
VSYPEVQKVESLLTVRVYDDCVTALVLVGNQLIKKLTYTIGSDEPVSANFLAFSDSVSEQYLIDHPCGPIEYRIKNEQAFAVLVPPDFNSPKEGHILIKTQDKAVVGSHKVTLQGFLPNFPDSKPGEIEFNVEIISTDVSAFEIPIVPLEPKEEVKKETEQNVEDQPVTETVAPTEEKIKEEQKKPKEESIKPE